MRVAAVVLVLAGAIAGLGTVSSGFTATATGGARFSAAPAFAPRLLERPAIEGIAREGEVLRAGEGRWARAPHTIRVEWMRCDDGAACAVVGEGLTREVGAGDVGTRFRVRVTATNDGGTGQAESEPTDVVAAMAPPVNLTRPTTSGDLVVGTTLTVHPGTWSGDALTITREWIRCTLQGCAAIPGETGDDYVLTGDDAGAIVLVRETAANAKATEWELSVGRPAIGRATYAQILCADPATGKGVTTDGALPDGLRVGGTLTSRFDPRPTTRCSPATTSPQVPLSTGGTYSTTTPDDRIVLEYRTPQNVDFRGATLYRHGTMSGRWSWAIQTASVTNLFGQPGTELCSWSNGCTTRGTATDRFGAQNKVDVPASANGFNVTLACDIGAGSRCDADGTQTVRLFGGTIVLRDTQTPKVIAKSGTLLSASPLPATADLDLTATDAGSGLWRIRATIDHEEVASRLVHDNQGRCRADGRFTAPQPCTTSAATSLLFDTTAWPSQGRLRVLLEDAGGNTTVLANRAL